MFLSKIVIFIFAFIFNKFKIYLNFKNKYLI